MQEPHHPLPPARGEDRRAEVAAWQGNLLLPPIPHPLHHLPPPALRRPHRLPEFGQIQRRIHLLRHANIRMPQQLGRHVQPRSPRHVQPKGASHVVDGHVMQPGGLTDLLPRPLDIAPVLPTRSGSSYLTFNTRYQRHLDKLPCADYMPCASGDGPRRVTAAGHLGR